MDDIRVFGHNELNFHDTHDDLIPSNPAHLLCFLRGKYFRRYLKVTVDLVVRSFGSHRLVHVLELLLRKLMLEGSADHVA